jgi:hypothetical protein
VVAQIAIVVRVWLLEESLDVVDEEHTNEHAPCLKSRLVESMGIRVLGDSFRVLGKKELPDNDCAGAEK